MPPLASRTATASSVRTTVGRVVAPRPVPAVNISPAVDQAKIVAASFATALMLATPLSTAAVGLESIELPALPQSESHIETMKAQQAKDAAEDEAFKNSDTLKKLLERTEANKSKNKMAIENKYCYRQAELGIGDCGGLRLIPGMTESGKQKTPEWLANMLGMEKEEEVAGDGPKTIKDFFKDGVEK